MSATGLKARQFLVTSQHPAARSVRAVYRAVHGFSLPTPKLLVKPMLWGFEALRGGYHYFKRVFICEPLFKAYCTRYGEGVHTGVFIPWVMGRGELLVGDRVSLHGQCSFIFSLRYCDRPTLEIGDDTGIGHNCMLTVGKRITIGKHCMISRGVTIFDSNGHPVTDAQARVAGLPPRADEVKPVTIGDNVWIGMDSMIFPGVTIGDGSIISARSVVRSHVRPYTVVAGNPARMVAELPRRASQAAAGPRTGVAVGTAAQKRTE